MHTLHWAAIALISAATTAAPVINQIKQKQWKTVSAQVLIWTASLTIAVITAYRLPFPSLSKLLIKMLP